jgi:hypothetical protein
MSVDVAAPRWRYSKSITPHDTTENARDLVGIVCDAAGSVSLTYKKESSPGTNITGTVWVAAGIPLFFPAIIRINNTGTTPTNIEGLVS